MDSKHVFSLKTVFLRFLCIQRSLEFSFSFLKDCIYLFLERGDGRQREGEKNQYVVASRVPQLGTWPATQACALTGNRTGDPLVHKPELNPLSYTSQGSSMVLIKINILIWPTRPRKGQWIKPSVIPPAGSAATPHIPTFNFRPFFRHILFSPECLHLLPLWSLGHCDLPSSSSLFSLPHGSHSWLPATSPHQFSMTLPFASPSQLSLYIHLLDLLWASPAGPS